MTEEIISGQTSSSIADCHICEVNLDWIDPFPAEGDRYAPRALEALMASIRSFGQISPAVVRQLPGTRRFELLTGRRRFWARRHLEDRVLFAAVFEAGERDLTPAAFQLPDNLNRDSPDPFDVANWMQDRKRVGGLTDFELAKQLGRSRSHVTQYLSINGLSPALKDLARRKARRLTIGFLIELAQFGNSEHARLVLEKTSDGSATRSGLNEQKDDLSARREAIRAVAAGRKMLKHLMAVSGGVHMVDSELAELVDYMRKAMDWLREARSELGSQVSQRGHINFEKGAV